MSYYAVRQGRTPGIYESWEECEPQIKKFSGAVYKSFKTLEEAQAYMLPEDPGQAINNDLPFAYIDGSFSLKSGLYGYGGFITYNGKTKIIQGSGNNPEYLQHRNITGELRGAIEVIIQATALNIPEINLYYDCASIENFITGAWKSTNKLTEYYKAFVAAHSIKINYIHVQGHTGDEGNTIADLLAKEATAQKLTKKEAAAIQEFKNRAGVQDPMPGPEK